MESSNIKRKRRARLMDGTFVETSINKIKLKKMVVTYNIPIGFNFEEFIKLWVKKVVQNVYLVEKDDFPDILYTEDNTYMYQALQELLNIDEQAAYHISTQIDNSLVEETFNRLYPTMDIDNLRESFQVQEVFDFIKKSEEDTKFTLPDIPQMAEDFHYSLQNYVGPATATAFRIFAEAVLLLTGLQEQRTHFRKV